MRGELQARVLREHLRRRIWRSSICETILLSASTPVEISALGGGPRVLPELSSLAYSQQKVYSSCPTAAGGDLT